MPNPNPFAASITDATFAPNPRPVDIYRAALEAIAKIEPCIVCDCPYAAEAIQIASAALGKALAHA